MTSSRYVLMTAARNEAAYVAKTIQAVLGQSRLPEKWVIVSDGSTDATDEIVTDYTRRCNLIQFVRRERVGPDQGFASKVYALIEAYGWLKDVDYEFIGNLDADVTFGTHYIEDILSKFNRNMRLGIAGGFIFEEQGGVFKSRPTNTTRSVAGAIQMFRRECYEGVGGLTPARLGGEDWIAEIKARRLGWDVEAFPEQTVYHHKASTRARGVLRERTRQGALAYSLGSYPLFEVFKCLRRVKEKPYFIGALIRMSSYFWCWVRRDERAVSSDIAGFLRAEQIARLRSYFKTVAGNGK